MQEGERGQWGAACKDPCMLVRACMAVDSTFTGGWGGEERPMYYYDARLSAHTQSISSESYQLTT